MAALDGAAAVRPRASVAVHWSHRAQAMAAVAGSVLRRPRGALDAQHTSTSQMGSCATPGWTIGMVRINCLWVAWMGALAHMSDS